MNKYNISKICPICEKVVNDDLKIHEFPLVHKKLL